MAIQYGRLSTLRRYSHYNHVYLQKFDSIDHSTNYFLSPRFSGDLINGHMLKSNSILNGDSIVYRGGR